MLIKYFRTNQSVILLALPLVALLFWAIHFFDNENAFISRGFLFELINENLAFSPLIWKIIAVILVSFQAYLSHRIISKSEVFSKNTHIPVLVVVFLASMLSYRGGIEPMLIANLFLLLAISAVLQIYHQNSAISFTFNAGFWIGMAALFEPACLILVFPAMVSVLILRAADWRELFFLLIGSVLPFGFLWVICFAFDTELTISENYFNWQMNELPYQNSGLFNSFLIIAAIICLWSFYFYVRSFKGMIIRIRKMRTALLYFILSFIFIYIWLYFTPFIPSQNQILQIPGMLLISFLLINHPKPFLTDTFIYVMIIIWIAFVYNLYFL